MRQSNLTLTEKQELSGALGNQVLMGAIRKVFETEATFWHNLLSSEAQKPDPNPTVLVQHAIREASALRVEKVLTRAAGV
jgi:hypothetical protein